MRGSPQGLTPNQATKRFPYFFELKRAFYWFKYGLISNLEVELSNSISRVVDSECTIYQFSEDTSKKDTRKINRNKNCIVEKIMLI